MAYIIRILLCLAASAMSVLGQCHGTNRTTFLRSSGFRLEVESPGPTLNIPAVSLEECTRRCRENKGNNGVFFRCNSFEYDEESSDCGLAGDSAPPFGPGQLVLDTGLRSFFQKICVPSQQLCSAGWAFERVPMAVLVGYALRVVTAPSLSECLRSCLEARSTFRIECKSLMYYHETKECILNREDRRNRPDLFTHDTQSYIVDYFDNFCQGTQCFAPEMSQYLVSKGLGLSNNREVELQGIDRRACSHFCNVNQDGTGGEFPCKSYMFSPGRCLLSAEQAMPRGRATLAHTPGLDHFEKICLTSRSTCGGASAFERVPQHVLVGFAKEALEVPSLPECLDLCLSAETDRGFPCRSVMYYYESTECLLNTEDRRSMPQLFAKETKDLIVDFFENNCLKTPGICAPDERRIYVRSDGTELPGFDTSGLQQFLLPQECVARCSAESGFACRSVEVTADGCVWSYQDSSLIPLTSLPASPSIYYEARCVRDAGRCGNLFYAFDRKVEMALEGSTSARIGGVSADACLSLCLNHTSVTKCSSVNYERKSSTCELNLGGLRTPGARLANRPGSDFYDNLCTGADIGCSYQEVEAGRRQDPLYVLAVLRNADLAQCTGECERATSFRCRSVSVEALSGSCFLSDQDGGSRTAAAAFLQPARGFQYYEPNKCQGTKVSIDCRLEGTRVNVHFPSASSGVVFVKNHMETCRQEYRALNSTQLSIPFPRSDKFESDNGLSDVACGGEEISPGVWSYMVVVQQNELGVPGLVTGEDQLFNATCDYSQAATLRVESKSVVGGSPVLSRIEGSAVDASGSAQRAVRMEILRDGRRVTKALLGEELQLHWLLVSNHDTDVDFFIQECHAFRLGGQPPTPDPLLLISNGCPAVSSGQRRLITTPVAKTQRGFETSIVMFRFDGSKSVQIKCTINMCRRRCPPAQCDIDGELQTSFGKRKKRQMRTYSPENSQTQLYDDLEPESNYANPDEEYEPEDDMMSVGEVSGVFTIVERVEDALDSDVQFQDAYADSTYPEFEPPAYLYNKGNVCLAKPLYLGGLVLISLLCFLEGGVVLAIFFCQQCGGRGRSSALGSRPPSPRMEPQGPRSERRASGRWEARKAQMRSAATSPQQPRATNQPRRRLWRHDLEEML